MQGGDVKRGKMQKLQQWLAENEEQLAQSTPDGVEYLGTYVNIYDSDRQAGAVKTFLRLDSYGAQDKLAATHGTVFGKLLEEMIEFMDFDSDNWSQALYKRMTDATLWGDD